MSNLTTSSALKAVSSLDGPVDLKKYTKIKPDAARLLCCEADLDLSGLKEFNPELAEAFARHHGKLILNGIKSLDKKTALALKENFKGSLHLGGIEQVDDEVAQILSERVAGDGSWSYWPKTIFSSIKKFNDSPGQIAFFKKLVKDAPRYDMHVTEITPMQAQILSEKDEELFYSSIVIISPEVAKELSNTSQNICLTSLKTLSPESAAALSTHKGELNLGNLEVISDKLALELSKHIGPVKLGGLKDLPDTEGYLALAEKLVRDNPKTLHMFTETLGEKVAEIFSKCEKPNFSYLKELKDCEGHLKLWTKMCQSADSKDSISFFGLTELPDRFAKIISESPAKVSLNSLNKWTEGAGHVAWATRLKTMSQAPGANEKIYIKGEYFPDKIAEIFSQCPNVDLQDIAILDDSHGNIELARRFSNESKYIRLKKISPQAAKILSEGRNDRWETSDIVEIDEATFGYLFAKKTHIYLSQLENIGAEVAKLCQGEKSLGFPKVKEISLEVAKYLGNGKGSLSLDGLESITPHCLEEIIRRDGEISLGGLKKISMEEAKLLCRAKGNLSLSSVEEIEDSVLEQLLELDGTRSLNLKSLREVPEARAKQMSARPGQLALDGLVSLNDSEGHIALSKKIATSWRVDQPQLEIIGPLAAAELGTNSTVKLKKLSNLTAETAQAFSNTKTLELTSVHQIDNPTSEKLGEMKGDLSLGNMDKVADEAFAAICKNKTRLSFHATELSVAKAKAISQIPALYIEGLEEMSLEAAKCFKGYKGDIYLRSLCRLSPEAAKELRKLKSKLSTTRSGEYALATGE